MVVGKLKLYELVKIAWHSSNPDFAQLLNKVWEVQQTDHDVIQIKALASTDTATWPYEFLNVYLNSYLAGQENEEYLQTRFWSCCYQDPSG